MRQRQRWLARRIAAVTGCASLLSGLIIAGGAAPGAALTRQAPAASPPVSCHLGIGV